MQNERHDRSTTGMAKDKIDDRVLGCHPETAIRCSGALHRWLEVVLRDPQHREISLRCVCGAVALVPLVAFTETGNVLPRTLAETVDALPRPGFLITAMNIEFRCVLASAPMALAYVVLGPQFSEAVLYWTMIAGFSLVIITEENGLLFLP